MRDFDLQPAKDLGLSPNERRLSLRREPTHVETVTHVLWWGVMRAYLKAWHRFGVHGLEKLPATPPFVLIANHSSHLDALMMASVLPYRLRDKVFPLAAGDVFFETPAVAAFATLCVNALPVWRQNMGRHALGELRKRLVEDPCIYILFPEGRRWQGEGLSEFRAGLGMMVAGTDVPVVPCWLEGAKRALPKGTNVPRPTKLSMHIGEAMRFGDAGNGREGWDAVAARSKAAVEALAPR